MTMKPEDRIKLQDAKLRVAKVLQDHGEAVNGYESVQFLITACTRRFGKRNMSEPSREYFDRIADGAPAPRQKYVGEKVGPYIVDLMKRPEWKPEPHLRADDIDALPHQVTVGGIGNGANWGGWER
jgi:hypothetical protein